MATENIFRFIQIDDQSITPKYLQLSHSLLGAIETGKLEKNSLLPSINEMSFELDISRDTVEKAYRHLKQVGIIGAIQGKGYYIANTDFKQPIRIFLLFNKLSAHKKIIYDAFTSKLGEQAAIDFYIYNNDLGLFRKLLKNRKEEYTHYVIIPHFLEGAENAATFLNEIENGYLLLLDKRISGLERKYGAAYENFEKDIYGALEKALPQLEKYQTLKIVFPSYTYFPVEILKGFQHFCNEYAFNYKVVEKIEEERIIKGEAYINLMEDDLVILLGKIQESKLQLGKDIGIISYNETPWKQFILDGITTISTDFRKMGEMAAQMVLDNDTTMKEVPFTLTLRKSL